MKYPKVNGKRCSKCHGYKVVRQLVRSCTGSTIRMATCDRCHGSGLDPQQPKKKGRR